MTTNSKNSNRLLAMIFGATIVFAGVAGAVKPTKDGKTCTDPRGKIKAGHPSQPPQQGNQAPKPGDSTKKWRDYINGNKKPPVRPKGKEQQRPRTGKIAQAPSQGGTSGNQAPKPGDSTKKWRDYINGNKKPPVRPKP